MTPEIVNIWMAVTGDRKEIRFDWGNDRHHAVMIERPHTESEVREALQQAAHLLARDPHLKDK